MFDRCAIAKEIAEDIEQQKCSTDSKECKIATEIKNAIINRECSQSKEEVKELITNIFDNVEVKDFMWKDIATLKIDNRYMYRGASKKELESLLNGGKSGGFWSNIPDFSYGGVFLIAKNKDPEYHHPSEIPGTYHLPLTDIKAIYVDTKNALFRIYPILNLDEFSRLFIFESKTEAEDYYKKWYLHSEFGEEIKKIAEMALEEGKAVPELVLQEYPGL